MIITCNKSLGLWSQDQWRSQEFEVGWGTIFPLLPFLPKSEGPGLLPAEKCQRSTVCCRLVLRGFSAIKLGFMWQVSFWETSKLISYLALCMHVASMLHSCKKLWDENYSYCDVVLHFIITHFSQDQAFDQQQWLVGWLQCCRIVIVTHLFRVVVQMFLTEITHISWTGLVGVEGGGAPPWLCHRLRPWSYSRNYEIVVLVCMDWYGAIIFGPMGHMGLVSGCLILRPRPKPQSVYAMLVYHWFNLNHLTE